MDHETLKYKLYEFYDGELPSGERESFEAHLKACAECRQELAFLKKASGLVFAKPAFQVPPGFSRRVMAGVLEESVPASPRFSWAAFWENLALPRWEIAAAVSVSLAISLYFSIHNLTMTEASSSDPVAQLYGEAGPEISMLSKDRLETEDIIQVAMGYSDEPEEGSYE